MYTAFVFLRSFSKDSLVNVPGIVKVDGENCLQNMHIPQHSASDKTIQLMCCLAEQCLYSIMSNVP